MRMPKPIHGLIQVGTYRSWSIKWPYRTERFIYFGAKADAEKEAKRLTGPWPYRPTIREIKL